MKSPILPFVIAAVAASGCATKRYVSREVGEIDLKVDNLSTQVERTQDRVRLNEARIGEVSDQAQAGIREVGNAAQFAMAKASDAERAAKGKLIYTVTLSEDKVTFPLNGTELGDDAKSILEDAIGPITAANRGVYFEIEGHTDSTGPDAYNKTLGEQRARAVRDYLHDQDGIALNRMQVISYGGTSPVENNDTREHRKQNRRVVIKVLE